MVENNPTTNSENFLAELGLSKDDVKHYISFRKYTGSQVFSNENTFDIL